MQYLLSYNPTLIIIETFNFETIESNNKLLPIALSYTENKHVNIIWVDEVSEDISLYLLLNFKSKIYYSHNLLLNFLLLIHYLNKNNIKYSWIFIEYKLYEVKIFYTNKIIILRCSHKLIPFPLETFYPTLSQKYNYISINKIDYENIKFSILNKNIESKLFDNTLKNKLSQTISNNLYVLQEGINTFFSTLKNLNIPFSKKNLTCGSIAFNFYFKNYNQINLNLPQEQKIFFSQAYFGGKCEVYGNVLDGEKILHFDFSGMYYNCMREELPFGDFIFKDSNFNLKEPGFYFIDIEYYSKYPVLPIKTDKLYFKEGRICGIFWYEEILLTLKYCKIVKFKILYAFLSLKNDKILIDFLDTLNKFKDDFSIKKLIGKLLINSFYGRLALGDEINFMHLVHDLKQEKCYGLIDNLYLIKKKSTKKPKANLAIAAAIASKARIKLYEAQCSVIEHGGRLLYSDTDSIFAAFKKNNPIENKLLGSHVFFDTKKPNTEILDAVFISSKTYTLVLKDNTEVIKVKGINIRDLNFKTIKDSFFLNKKHIILNSNQISKKNLDLKTNIISKEINLQEYNKRLWIQNKTDTLPHSM